MKLRAWLAVLYCLGMLVLIVTAIALARRNGTETPEDILYTLGMMGFAIVGALLVVQRPNNLIGWIFCADVGLNAVGALANDAAVFALVTQPGALPGPEWLAWISTWSGDTGWVLLLTFTFLLFPTGHVPSTRWRPLAWLLAAMLLFHIFVTMLRPGPFADLPAFSNPLGVPLPAWLTTLDDLLGIFVVLPALASIASLMFRFRAASGDVRQQIKWIALVAAVIFVVLIGIALAEVTRQKSVIAASEFAFALGLVAFPAAVGISILRHRLWDIDLIIRRTLVYSVLTALLALAYFASVLVLQPPLARLTGQGNQLATVLSTLFIAGLFVPLRGWVQRAIDRRFYRAKVDAARTLAAFSAAARDEVDLDHLTGALLESVGESFQPEHVSLWVPGRAGSGGEVATGGRAARAG
jgi:hypothetical protein